jgi:SAM-dependent MidA family methyltransferase
MPRDILPEPPDELKQLSATLSERIHGEISREGMIPFSRYMEMALYEPGLGYYSAGLHKFGDAGDFTTAPELGSLFAACLSRQVAELAGYLGGYDVLEVGAGSGRLAAGLLTSLDSGRLPRRYRILERSADLRKVQEELISSAAPELLHRVEWLDRPPEDDWSGVLIANEVIDALAVERFELASGELQQLCVKTGEGGFDWTTRPAPPALQAAVKKLGADQAPGFMTDLTDGYRSEICLQLAPWLEALTARMARGLALFIDYGYPRSEYYSPERVDGTLMCHYRHRAHDDVFFWPGLQDITAWVDFTALAEASLDCGLELEGYSTQAMFLLGCGLEEAMAEILARRPDAAPELGAEARQLTMPGMMGERFQVMGLGRGIGQPLRGFSLQDLRHRL